jgi:hypothetical protein
VEVPSSPGSDVGVNGDELSDLILEEGDDHRHSQLQILVAVVACVQVAAAAVDIVGGTVDVVDAVVVVVAAAVDDVVVVAAADADAAAVVVAAHDTVLYFDSCEVLH